MATYTGLFMAGTPHPNDDGLMYHREPRRLWLSENSRAVWCLDSPALAVGDDRRGQTVLIPKRPSSILDDGLLMIATHVLKVDEVKSALINSLDCDELPARINLAKSVTSEHHRCLIELSRWHSVGDYFKLIITNFSGCSIEQHMPVLEHYGYDVEVLETEVPYRSASLQIRGLSGCFRYAHAFALCTKCGTLGSYTNARY